MFLPDEKEVSSMCCVFVVWSKSLLFPNEIQSTVDSNIVDRHPQMFVVDRSPMVKKMLQGPCFFSKLPTAIPRQLEPAMVPSWVSCWSGGEAWERVGGG